MNRDDIIELLQVIQSYDNRDIGQTAIAAWYQTAQRGRWTKAAALEAVHTHFTNSTTWLMPGHVTTMVRAAMRQPAPAAEVLAIDKPIASDSVRRKAMAEIAKLAESKRIPE